MLNLICQAAGCTSRGSNIHNIAIFTSIPTAHPCVNKVSETSCNRVALPGCAKTGSHKTDTYQLHPRSGYLFHIVSCPAKHHPGKQSPGMYSPVRYSPARISSRPVHPDLCVRSHHSAYRPDSCRRTLNLRQRRLS